MSLCQLVNNVKAMLLSTTLLCTLSQGCAAEKKYDLVKLCDPHTVPNSPSLEKTAKPALDYSKLSYQEVIEYIETPEEAYEYCVWLNQKKGMPWGNGKFFGFKRTHEGSEQIDCTEVAYAAAATLSDNGFPPIILWFVSEKNLDHMVFLYRKNNKFGSIGRNSIDCARPVYKDVKALAEELNLRYHVLGFSFNKYLFFNLNDNYPDYITADYDLPRTYFYLHPELMKYIK